MLYNEYIYTYVYRYVYVCKLIGMILKYNCKDLYMHNNVITFIV